MSNITAVITAFNRPDALRRLYASLLRACPALPVVVVDTGEQPADLPDHPLLSYRQRGDLRANCSAARNVGAKKAKTDCVLLLEDDCELTRDVLPEMLDALSCADVVTAVPLLRGESASHLPRDMELADGELRLVRPRRPATRTPAGTLYQPCDLSSCLILARRETLLAHPWDESIPIDQTFDWFWSLKQAGVRVAQVPSATVNHWPSGDAEYRAVRKRSYRQRLKEKWGIERILAVG